MHHSKKRKKLKRLQFIRTQRGQLHRWNSCIQRLVDIDEVASRCIWRPPCCLPAYQLKLLLGKEPCPEITFSWNRVLLKAYKLEEKNQCVTLHKAARKDKPCSHAFWCFFPCDLKIHHVMHVFKFHEPVPELSRIFGFYWTGPGRGTIRLSITKISILLSSFRPSVLCHELALEYDWFMISSTM